MEVAGAVDSHLVGDDIGKVSDMEEALEIPILNDLAMVLGSISQYKGSGVVVDFTDQATVYENVKQAIAFGMSSVVYVPRIKQDTVMALSGFCEKASMGCLVAPTLSIGSMLLQQAAISASFHYQNVEIVESRPKIFLPTMRNKLQTTSLTLVSYTTEKIYQQMLRPEVRFLEKMGCECTAWSFQGCQVVQRSTSPGLARYTQSNMISQICNLSCQV